MLYSAWPRWFIGALNLPVDFKQPFGVYRVFKRSRPVWFKSVLDVSGLLGFRNISW